VEALEKFIEVASVPIVTTFNKDPSNHPYVVKFFNSDSAKVRTSSWIAQQHCTFPCMLIILSNIC